MRFDTIKVVPINAYSSYNHNNVTLFQGIRSFYGLASISLNSILINKFLIRCCCWFAPPPIHQATSLSRKLTNQSTQRPSFYHREVEFLHLPSYTTHNSIVMVRKSQVKITVNCTSIRQIMNEQWDYKIYVNDTNKWKMGSAQATSTFASTSMECFESVNRWISRCVSG